jgi:hypothetical protein
MTRKLSSDERARVAEKVMELGNMIVAALVIGQLLIERKDPYVAGLGIAVFFGLYMVAYQIMKRG